MTDVASIPQYRMEVRAPRSEQSDPLSDEADVCLPRAGALHTDPFRVTTMPDDGTGWKPYLQAPTGRRGTLNLRERTVDVGQFTAELLDKRLGTDNSERWVSQFFSDANGQSRLEGCRVHWWESLDDGCSWDPFAVCRIETCRRNRRLTWQLEQRDLSDDQKRDIFVGRPHSSLAYAQLTPLLPHHNLAAYGAIPAGLRVPATVDDTGAVKSFAFRSNDNFAPYDQWCVVGSDLSTRGTDSQRLDFNRNLFGAGNPRIIVIFTFPTGVLRAHVRRNSNGATGEYWVRQIECRTDKVHAIARKVTVEELDPSDEFYQTWAAMGPSSGLLTASLHVQEGLSTQSAILIDRAHPIQLLADICDGKFGPLHIDGTVQSRIRRDAANPIWAQLIADLTFGTASFIITGSAENKAWVKDNLCKTFGFAHAPDAEGYLTPFDLRPREPVLTLPAITDDDIIAEVDAAVFEQGVQDAVNVVTVEYAADFAIPDLAPARDTDQYPQPPPGLINTQIQALDFPKITEALPEIIDRGLRPLTVKAEGIRYISDDSAIGKSAAQAAEERARQVANDWLTLYQRGSRIVSLRCRRTAVPRATTLGAQRLIQVSTLFNPGTQKFDEALIGRCVEKTENGPELLLRLLVEFVGIAGVPPTTQADPPTIDCPTLALPGEGAPTGAFLYDDVTLNGDGEPAELWTAVTDTSVIVPPDDDDPLWTFSENYYGSGPQLHGPFQFGIRIWTRARTRATASKQPSDWVHPPGDCYIDTGAIGTVAVTVTDITPGSANVSWTGGVDGDRVEVLLHASHSAVWLDSEVIEGPRTQPPRSTRLVGLDADQDYAVGVRLVDSQGGRGAVTQYDFHTDSGTDLLTRPAGITFEFWSAISGHVFSNDFSHAITIEYTPDDTPGSVYVPDAPDLGSPLYASTVIPARARGDFFIPFDPDYTIWWFRARHEALGSGETSSDWTPWVWTSARPASGFPPPPNQS